MQDTDKPSCGVGLGADGATWHMRWTCPTVE